MSTDPQPNVNVIEEQRKQINRLIDEVARMAEMELQPADFYGEFLKRLLLALGAPAGVVWGRTAQGNLQLQFQINMQQVGLTATEEGRESHDELLRQMVANPRPLALQPHSSAGAAQGGAEPGNPTDFINLLVPIVVDQQVSGIVEVWHTPDRNPAAIPGYIQFMMRLAELATRFTRNAMLRQIVGQQQLWIQLESFARQAHSSLNPTEVSYLIANEGRRLIDCDRVSVGIRYGRKVKVEAISGADVVEKRSNLVRLMRKLFDAVIKWGEKLVFTGKKDDTLPPDVHKALDEYLAESNSSLLVVMPLRDEREGTDHAKKPSRSALMMECFEPPSATDPLFARLEVIGKHAATGLYNAVEHRRIPFRWVWQPIAAVQEGLGGKTKAIIYSITAAVIALILVLVFVPYPLKMDSPGQVEPVIRRWVYSPTQMSQVVAFHVNPNEQVGAEQNLVLMYDADLHEKILKLNKDIAAAEESIQAFNQQLSAASTASAVDKARMKGEREQQIATRKATREQRDSLFRRVNAEESRPGYFWIKAPDFPPDTDVANPSWTVLNADFRETLTDKQVKPSDPILRLGEKNGRWEIELKIPQKHSGQVKAAFDVLQRDELDVDILVRSAPTTIYKGKLARNKIAGEATPNRDEQNESEPVVLAYVRLDGEGIPDEYCLPKQAPHLLVAGTEVHTKIRCGDYRMGYSLFYGVWEFFYEKVVFFF